MQPHITNIHGAAFCSGISYHYSTYLWVSWRIINDILIFVVNWMQEIRHYAKFYQCMGFCVSYTAFHCSSCTRRFSCVGVMGKCLVFSKKWRCYWYVPYCSPTDRSQIFSYNCYAYWLSMEMSTYWVWEKMATILLAEFSNSLHIRIVEFLFKCQWNLFPMFQLTLNMHWSR